jgi:hypothetical protein
MVGLKKIIQKCLLDSSKLIATSIPEHKEKTTEDRHKNVAGLKLHLLLISQFSFHNN